jgi:2-dehydropantoate 2-reductase
MRITIVGAGGVGGLIGGLLAHAGTSVAFVARGAQLEALRRDGLHVESTRGTFHLAKVEASDDPAALAPADAVLVAVKGWQLPDLAPRLAPLVARGGFAVPLQNGVEAAEVLEGALGREHVVGGLCHLSAWLEAPGRVKHITPILRVTIGERHAARGGSERVEALANELRRAKVDVVVSDDLDMALWQKLLFVGITGAVGAVTRAPAGVMRTLPEARALLTQGMEEIAALASARGVRMPPDAVRQGLATLEAMPPQTTASMHRDIVAGRPSELEDQIGAVVRLAAQSGVDVPLNRFLYAALLPQERAARGL